MNIKSAVGFLLQIDFIKSIRLSFHYFTLRDALKLPILVSWRTRLQVVRGGVKTECKVIPGMLKFGFRGLGTQDSYYERSIWEVDGVLRFSGPKVHMGRGTRLSVSGECTFGNDVTITGRSTVMCQNRVKFGDGVLVSWDVLIMDTDGGHSIFDDEGHVLNKDRAIDIGNKVWIGCRTTVLKGATIPDNSIIAACSVVTGKMDYKGCVYTSGGKILKESISWIK